MPKGMRQLVLLAGVLFPPTSGSPLFAGFISLSAPRDGAAQIQSQAEDLFDRHRELPAIESPSMGLFADRCWELPAIESTLIGPPPTASPPEISPHLDPFSPLSHDSSYRELPTIDQESPTGDAKPDAHLGEGYSDPASPIPSAPLGGDHCSTTSTVSTGGSNEQQIGLIARSSSPSLDGEETVSSCPIPFRDSLYASAIFHPPRGA